MGDGPLAIELIPLEFGVREAHRLSHAHSDPGWWTIEERHIVQKGTLRSRRGAEAGECCS